MDDLSVIRFNLRYTRKDLASGLKVV